MPLRVFGGIQVLDRLNGILDVLLRSRFPNFVVRIVVCPMT
jgi:hypothetical protein